MSHSLVLTALLACLLASAATAHSEILPEAQVRICDDITDSCARHLLGRRDGTVTADAPTKMTETPVASLTTGRKLTKQATPERKLLVAKKPVKRSAVIADEGLGL